MKLFESLKAGDKVLCFSPFQDRMDLITVESISINETVLIKTNHGNINIKFGTAWLSENNSLIFSCKEAWEYYLNNLNNSIEE